jgi:hypothetical protein
LDMQSYYNKVFLYFIYPTSNGGTPHERYHFLRIAHAPFLPN